MDTKALRSALSKFATGITVVTTVDEDKKPYGVTVNSFTSVSLEPALALWCLGDQTFALNTFLNAEHFAVNILSSEQEDVSNNFAVAGEFDRFATIPHNQGTTGVPLITGCLANFECKRYQVERIGDHWVFICKIKSFSTNGEKPLIYYSSQYCQLRTQA